MAAIPQTFLGYRRADGTVGIRNHLLVVPSVICANTVAQRVASLLPGAVAIPHPHGCAEVGDDVTLTEKILAGAAANPNVGAALIVGLGCETCQADHVADLARDLAPGRPIESYYIQEAGGSIKAIARGVEVGKQMMARIAAQQREAVPLAELIVGGESGDGDPTSSRAANPTLGLASERTLDAGGTVILSERLGGTLPGGKRAVQETLKFGERPPGTGLFAMRTTEQDAVSVSAMAAGGSQLCIFTTGRGAPLGNAICPVIKVTANPETEARMQDNIDFSAAPIVEGDATAEAMGERLFQLMLDVCSGQLTNAEIIGHQEFAVHRIGPTV